MSNILCNKSGILFHCEYMPISLSNREYYHPLFTLPKKRLLALAGDWAVGKIPKTESYLLFLALLDSTSLIQWRQPARYTDKTNAIVANNMENLLHIIGKIDVIKHPTFTLPQFVISYDTGDLSNVHHWIQTWIGIYNDWHTGYKFAATERLLERREQALEKLIRSEHVVAADKNNKILLATNDKLGINIAEWAADAGSFPKSLMTHPFIHTPITISDYWKQIIRASIDMSKIWYYPQKDIEELIDHSEDYISHGSIYAHTLMARLKGGLQKKADFESFGDFDLDSEDTRFTLLDAETDNYTVNKMAAINAAPKDEPKRENYATHFLYIKAKLNWSLAAKNSAIHSTKITT